MNFFIVLSWDCRSNILKCIMIQREYGLENTRITCTHMIRISLWVQFFSSIKNHLLVYNELFVSIAKADSSLDWLYAQEEMCGVAPDENNIY